MRYAHMLPLSTPYCVVHQTLALRFDGTRLGALRKVDTPSLPLTLRKCRSSPLNLIALSRLCQAEDGGHMGTFLTISLLLRVHSTMPSAMILATISSCCGG